MLESVVELLDSNRAWRLTWVGSRPLAWAAKLSGNWKVTVAKVVLVVTPRGRPSLSVIVELLAEYTIWLLWVSISALVTLSKAPVEVIEVALATPVLGRGMMMSAPVITKSLSAVGSILMSIVKESPAETEDLLDEMISWVLSLWRGIAPSLASLLLSSELDWANWNAKKVPMTPVRKTRERTKVKMILGVNLVMKIPATLCLYLIVAFLSVFVKW